MLENVPLSAEMKTLVDEISLLENKELNLNKRLSEAKKLREDAKFAEVKTRVTLNEAEKNIQMLKLN